MRVVSEIVNRKKTKQEEEIFQSSKKKLTMEVWFKKEKKTNIVLL
jgi:hypothetical protein